MVDDVPDYGVGSGNPARHIRSRYDAADVERLLELAWWDWPVEHITENIETILSGSIENLSAAAPGLS